MPTNDFKAQIIDEVAIIIVREDLYESHRSYDALQYPIIFWQSNDGYHFSIKIINPLTGNWKFGLAMKILYYRQVQLLLLKP